MCPIWEYFSCSSQTCSFIVMCGGEGFSQDHLLGSEFWRHLIFNKSFDDGISMILKYFSSVRTLFKACMDTWIFWMEGTLVQIISRSISQSNSTKGCFQTIFGMILPAWEEYLQSWVKHIEFVSKVHGFM